MGIGLVAQRHLPVIGDIEIQGPIAIQVPECQGHARMVCIEVAIEGRFGELSLTIIEKNVASTHYRIDNQVEVSVTINIGKARSCYIQVTQMNPGSDRNIFETPVPQVAEEVTVTSKTREEEIAPAIPVDVARRNARAVQENLVCKMTFLGQVIGEKHAD